MSARRALGALVLVGAVALTVGCGAGDTTPPEPEETSTAETGEPTAEDVFDVAADGDPLVIEPLAGIDGAERFTGAGVGLDMTADMDVTTTELGDTGVQYSFTVDGSDRAVLIVTVTDQENANEIAVDASARMTELQVAGNVADLTHHPVEWDGMPYAVAFTGALDLVAADELSEVALVTTHSPDGDQLVAISVEARPGEELTESLGYEVLRTVRFEE